MRDKSVTASLRSRFNCFAYTGDPEACQSRMQNPYFFLIRYPKICPFPEAPLSKAVINQFHDYYKFVKRLRISFKNQMAVCPDGVDPTDRCDNNDLFLTFLFFLPANAPC